MRYILHAPMIITSRLMPGVKIGDSSISILPMGWNGHGYAIRYYIDTPTGEIYMAEDITVSRMCDQDEIAQEAVRTVCAFLSAEAEGYAGSGQMGTCEPTDGYMFNATVAEWAYLNSDEIGMIVYDLDEGFEA